MSLLNLANCIDCTEVEGPGKRLALWVQGCLIRCPGCCNPHLFELSPMIFVESSEVAARIKRAAETQGIEGVTFLGGEPMLQARGLAEIAAFTRALGLSVMVFSGYRLEEIRRLAMPGTADLLRHTDVLVDGPYVSNLPEQDRNWVGSVNQRFHYFSDRYQANIERDPAYARGIEIRVGLHSEMKLNGWPVDV